MLNCMTDDQPENIIICLLFSFHVNVKPIMKKNKNEQQQSLLHHQLRNKLRKKFYFIKL